MSLKTICFTLLACFAAVAIAIEPFAVAHIDRSVSGSSQEPAAVNPARVGTFPGNTKSGAGYFYDEVLEYRVWLDPQSGAADLAGGSDYFAAFAQYEKAEAFSKSNQGAEPPLVLVRQLEYINEPKPGHYVAVKEDRITEWRVEWLAGSKRGPNSIAEFLAHPRAAHP